MIMKNFIYHSDVNQYSRDYHYKPQRSNEKEKHKRESILEIDIREYMERQTANKKKYGMNKSEGLNKIRNADLYEKVDKHGKIYEKNI